MKTIDLISFLHNYYGIYHTSLRRERITHADIKLLFPYIRTCKYEDVYPEDIVRGLVLGVYDRTNRIVYYYNPHLIVEQFEEDELTDDEEFSFEIDDYTLLSKNELLKIRRKLRLEGHKRQALMITKLIRKKKQEEPLEYRKKNET